MLWSQLIAGGALPARGHDLASLLARLYLRTKAGTCFYYSVQACLNRGSRTMRRPLRLVGESADTRGHDLQHRNRGGAWQRRLAVGPSDSSLSLFLLFFPLSLFCLSLSVPDAESTSAATARVGLMIEESVREHKGRDKQRPSRRTRADEACDRTRGGCTGESWPAGQERKLGFRV